MSKSAIIRARVEPEIKEKGETILKHLGLSTSDFINMTYRQLIMQKGLPFDVRIPNEETIKALEESEADYKANRLKSYSSSKEMMDDILGNAGK